MAEMHDTTEEYLETILELEEEGIVPLRARIAVQPQHVTTGRGVDGMRVQDHGR